MQGLLPSCSCRSRSVWTPVPTSPNASVPSKAWPALECRRGTYMAPHLPLLSSVPLLPALCFQSGLLFGVPTPISASLLAPRPFPAEGETDLHLLLVTCLGFSAFPLTFGGEGETREGALAPRWGRSSRDAAPSFRFNYQARGCCVELLTLPLVVLLCGPL